MKYALLILALFVAAPASASPARWSLSRASLGLDAKAAITEPAVTSAFLGGAYLSYSLTSNLSVAAIVERDFAGKLTIFRAGARFPIMQVGEGRVTAGGGLVSYADEGAAGIVEPTSWDASLHGSWPIATASDGSTTFWGVGSASYDTENARSTYRLGIRWQAVGGVPQ